MESNDSVDLIKQIVRSKSLSFTVEIDGEWIVIRAPTHAGSWKSDYGLNVLKDNRWHDISPTLKVRAEGFNYYGPAADWAKNHFGDNFKLCPLC